jgi:hypothetical protein
MIKMFGRWCEVTVSDPSRREAEADKLIRGIHGSDRIERLTGNPMMLTTMALSGYWDVV